METWPEGRGDVVVMAMAGSMVTENGLVTATLLLSVT